MFEVRKYSIISKGYARNLTLTNEEKENAKSVMALKKWRFVKRHK